MARPRLGGRALDRGPGLPLPGLRLGRAPDPRAARDHDPRAARPAPARDRRCSSSSARSSARTSPPRSCAATCRPMRSSTPCSTAAPVGSPPSPPCSTSSRRAGRRCCSGFRAIVWFGVANVVAVAAVRHHPGGRAHVALVHLGRGRERAHLPAVRVLAPRRRPLTRSTARSARPSARAWRRQRSGRTPDAACEDAGVSVATVRPSPAPRGHHRRVAHGGTAGASSRRSRRRRRGAREREVTNQHVRLRVTYDDAAGAPTSCSPSCSHWNQHVARASRARGWAASKRASTRSSRRSSRCACRRCTWPQRTATIASSSSCSRTSTRRAAACRTARGASSATARRRRSRISRACTCAYEVPARRESRPDGCPGTRPEARTPPTVCRSRSITTVTGSAPSSRRSASCTSRTGSRSTRSGPGPT